jgi:hypothetical protein
MLLAHLQDQLDSTTANARFGFAAGWSCVSVESEGSAYRLSVIPSNGTSSSKQIAHRGSVSFGLIARKPACLGNPEDRT